MVKRELAAGIAATLVFFFSVMFIPVMGIFTGIFTPLPTLLSFYRWGLPLGFFVPGVTALVGSAVLIQMSAVESIPYLIEMLLFGLLLGAGMRQSWSFDTTIWRSSLAIMVMGAIVFLAANTIGEGAGGLVKRLEEDLYNSIALTLEQYGAMTAEKRLLEDALRRMVPWMVRLLPGAALASTLIVAVMNVLLALRYFRIRSLPLPPWVEWSQWKTPEPLVWGVVASGFALLVPVEPLRTVSFNVLLVLGIIYLFQGLAVIGFYFDRWGLPRLLRGIFYGILFLQQFVTLGAILVGLFDVWFDFRRISRKSLQDGPQ